MYLFTASLVVQSHLGKLFIVAVCSSEHLAGSLLAGVAMLTYEVIPTQNQAIFDSTVQLLTTCLFGMSPVLAEFLLA